MSKTTVCWLVTAAVAFGWIRGVGPTAAEDWRMLGRDGTRNSVSSEQGAPLIWSVERHEENRVIGETRGVRWQAQLGLTTFSSPVISNGLVWIGTSDPQPPKEINARPCGVLKCFREADGVQVYEYWSPPLPNRPQDQGWHGLGSSPLIEGDRLWLATNRALVICLDIGPLIRGEGQPRELWKRDLIETFAPFQRIPLMGPPRPCSIGPSWNGRIFVTINNGIDESYMKVPKPEAPSLACLNKDTGELFWTDNSPGANILMTQFASPTIANIGGQTQVIVPQSDGWVRGFDPQSGAKLWEFDINSKESQFRLGGRSTRNTLLGNAVVYEDRVYIASGDEPEHGEGVGRLVCIDPTRRGDVSSELAVDANDKPLPQRGLQVVNRDMGEKSITNPNSALLWEFRSDGKSFDQTIHRSMSSVAIAKGLVIAVDFSGLVLCFDARTGKRYWSHDVFAAIWVSPLIVDDKVYVADEDGEVSVFRLTTEPHEPLQVVEMEGSIYASPVFANGSLYVASRSKLSAITGDKLAEAKNFSSAANWPQWRGPNRDNVSTDTGLLKEWPDAGPPLLWRLKGLGDGISPPSLGGGRLFTLSQYEDMEYVRAFNERTGDQLWTAVLGGTHRVSPLMRWYTQRPATLDGELVFAVSLPGDLVCLRATNGEEVWRKNYRRDFAGQPSVFGFTDCPVVDGDRLICTPGGPQSSIVALDKNTGDILWKCAVPDAGHEMFGNGTLATIDGQRQFVVNLEKGLVGVSVSDGTLLWRYDGAVDKNHTPLIRDGLVLCASYGNYHLLEPRKVNGVFEVSERLSKIKLPLAQIVDDSVIVADRLFEPNNAIFSCLDWKLGSVVWQVRIGQMFTSTYADERFYLHSTDGKMRLAEPGQTAPVIKSEFVLPDHRDSMGTTTPVVTGGKLYVREDDQLFCYDLRASSSRLSDEPRTITLTVPPASLLQSHRERLLRSVFVPTPQDVVDKLLDEAAIKQNDVICDLGSGDGRIVITAAKKYGCKALGVELDNELVELSLRLANDAGVTPLVTFNRKDLFTEDLTDVDVLAVYLLPEQLKKLLPQIEKMKPGSRLLSHQFAIPGIAVDKTITIESKEDGTKHTIYLWTLPLKKP